MMLVDVQGDFWKDEMSQDRDAFEKSVRALLGTCRDDGIDVVHVRASFKSDKSDWMLRYALGDSIPCIEGTPGAEILASAEPVAGEPVLDKQTYDAFSNPRLEDWLTANDKQFLLVAGLVTSVCILLTAATAAQRGYLVAVVEDCCADEPAAHEHTLQRYPFMFDRVTSGEIIGRHRDWLDLLERVTTARPRE